MSRILEAEHDSEVTTFTAAEQMRTMVEGARLTPDSFAVQASDIFGRIREAKERNEPLAEVYRAATESYVNNAENDILKLQADVILTAPIASGASRRLDDMEAGRTFGSRDERRALTRQLVRYNHGIRDLILAGDGKFASADLENWLDKGSGGANASWAGKLVRAMSAEVAVARAIATGRGVGSVEFSSVEDDLKGVDLRVKTIDGRVLPIDVKYGRSRPLSDDTARENTHELGINEQSLIGFDLDPVAAQGMRNTVGFLTGYEQEA